MDESNEAGGDLPEADVRDLPRRAERPADVEESAAEQVKGGRLRRETDPAPGGPVPIPYPNAG